MVDLWLDNRAKISHPQLLRPPFCKVLRSEDNCVCRISSRAFNRFQLCFSNGSRAGQLIVLAEGMYVVFVLYCLILFFHTVPRLQIYRHHPVR